MGALKDLKRGLYSVKKDQQEGFQELRNEFDDKLRTLASQVVLTQTSHVEQRYEDEEQDAPSVASSYHAGGGEVDNKSGSTQ